MPKTQQYSCLVVEKDDHRTIIGTVKQEMPKEEIEKLMRRHFPNADSLFVSFEDEWYIGDIVTTVKHELML